MNSMLTMQNFLDYNIGANPYSGIVANVKLDDLLLKEDVTPKLSILMSVFHRYSQLQRTLETLCRQQFKDFEVLIYDNDDDEHIEKVVEQFTPYLHLKLFKKQGGVRRFDPSISFKEMLPSANGDVIALMQPECMLYPTATYWLYFGHDLIKEKISDLANIYNIENALPVSVKDWNSSTCITLKSLWLCPKMQTEIDKYDWHTDITNLYKLPEFWTGGCGLSNFSNTVWAGYNNQIWWLVFSFRKDSGILQKFPDVLGHASIDFYMINYRTIHNYIDIMPYEPLSIHQEHHRMSFSPEGEQAFVSNKEYYKE